jgi:hypothetical protein
MIKLADEIICNNTGRKTYSEALVYVASKGGRLPRFDEMKAYLKSPIV